MVTATLNVSLYLLWKESDFCFFVPKAPRLRCEWFALIWTVNTRELLSGAQHVAVFFCFCAYLCWNY